MAPLRRARDYVRDEHLSFNAPLLAVLLASAAFWVLVALLIMAAVDSTRRGDCRGRSACHALTVVILVILLAESAPGFD
jgi:hypothetical protein